MKRPTSPSLVDPPTLSTEAVRQQAVRFALRLTEGTLLAPANYERMLLEQFVRGDLTIDQVLARLEARGRE